jgi:HAD superfamily hydrolase (TIGR01509 family)
MVGRTVIRAVLFDLDDTLFDHRESAAEALRRVYGAYDCFRTVRFEEFERQHACLLEELHSEVLSGRLGIDDARRQRFRRLFAQFGGEPTDDLCSAAANQYRGGYVEARRAILGAAKLLAAVRRRASVGVVSNNLRQEQIEKLEHCKLAAYVDALVVSEEAGVSKPDPAIFTLALKALRVEPAEAVMVGDSWSADVVGARAAGIRPVWFNPLRLPSPEPELGVPEVHALEPANAALRAIFGEDRRQPVGRVTRSRIRARGSTRRR